MRFGWKQRIKQPIKLNRAVQTLNRDRFTASKLLVFQGLRTRMSPGGRNPNSELFPKFTERFAAKCERLESERGPLIGPGQRNLAPDKLLKIEPR